MKIYRCVIGCLLVFFIVIGVWYIASCYNEQRSTDDGTLIWEQNRDYIYFGEAMRGVVEDVADYRLC